MEHEEGLSSLMGLTMPDLDNSEDRLRLEMMMQRIRELQGDPDAPPLPAEVSQQLESMKEEIGSLQEEMEAIRRDVQDAVRAITQQTTSILTQVQSLSLEEEEEEEKAERKE